MAKTGMVLLLLQTGLVVVLALAWSVEGVRAAEEESGLGEALVDTAEAQQQDRSLFVRRRLTESGYGGSRVSSCSYNKAICTKSPYPAGSICCGSSCTNVQTDYSNCGACGKKCGWSQTCCGGKCVYLSSDSNNCGKCGLKCPRNGCKYGVCRYSSGGKY